MSELDYLRSLYKEEEDKRKWWQPSKTHKEDTTLYLSARMHDAENKAKEMEKLAYNTERAAIHILKRYDSNGDLIREFKDTILALNPHKGTNK